MLFSFVLVLALRMRGIGEADPPPNPSDRGPHGQVFVRGVESTPAGCSSDSSGA